MKSVSYLLPLSYRELVFVVFKCCATNFLLTPCNSSPSLLLFICRNPHGQSVGHHRAGLDHISREWGELVCLCVQLCIIVVSPAAFVPFAC